MTVIVPVATCTSFIFFVAVLIIIWKIKGYAIYNTLITLYNFKKTFHLQMHLFGNGIPVFLVSLTRLCGHVAV